MKLKQALYLLPVALMFFAFSVGETAYAQSNCLTVNGGGATTKQVCTNSVPAQQNTNSQTAPNQTKGGLPIYPSSNTQSTPSTGPEDWALPSLVILCAAGLLLRKKAKSSFYKN